MAKGKKKHRKDDLAGEIYGQMGKVGYRITHRDNTFVSIEFLKELFNRPSLLRRSLRQHMDAYHDEKITDNNLDDLQKYVINKATKLYAVLLLLGEPQLIVSLFRSQSINDDIFQQYQNEYGPFFHESFIQHPLLLGRTREIYELQWQIPPILYQDIHRTWPIKGFRFPFVERPHKGKQGSWGLVSKVMVANGHLIADADDYTPGSYVAHKEVHKHEKISRDKLLKEVNTLRARKHENIVPLLASFSAGSEDPETANPVEEYLHMFFPWATNGDMKSWLACISVPDSSLESDETRHTFIYNAMRDLVAGLAYIHREIDSKVGFHHDLKPGNILMFSNGSKTTWKICDFGNANLKNPQDGTGTECTPENRFGTYMYRPPEYFFSSDSGDGADHGRSFDIFSLGCVYLELATVYRHGWDKSGLQRFRDRRAENTIYVYTGLGHEAGDTSFHNNMGVVMDWIKYLEEDQYSDANLRKLLHLIRGMLEGRKQRIFAWELDMDLYELGHQHEPRHKLERRLHDLVQPSREPLNALDNQHNPLRRAIENRRPEWWKKILREMHWSYDKPTATKEIANKRWNAERIHIHRSTLTSFDTTHAFGSNQLYGRHKVDNQISKGFETSYCVTLYGKSGIGKSHLAYRHTVRYRDTEKDKDKKHTFWVDATSLSNFLGSMNKIARIVELDDGLEAQETPLTNVKDWLADVERNGPWIMVLDGLNHKEVARTAEKYLPKDCGQILITTKDRALCEPFLRLKQNEQIIQVDDLEKEDRRAVFRWYIEDELVTENDQYIDDLLDKISLPQSIILLGRYLTEYRIHSQKLYKSLKEGNPGCIRGTMFELYRELLSPLIPHSSKADRPSNAVKNWPSKEMELLGILSCFSHDSVELELILKLEHYKEYSILEGLGTLENYALVGKGTDGNYFMREFTQTAIRDWIELNMGIKCLFKLHETALQMLYRLYSERKHHVAQAGSIKTRRSSYSSKLKYMAHFERFHDFAKYFSTNGAPTHGAVNYCIGDATVKAIYTFSQVYMEEALNNDAIFILRFAHAKYKDCRHSYRLKHLLFQAHLQGSEDSDISKAENLIGELTKEAESEKDEIRQWELTLDLARFYTKINQPNKSIKYLQAQGVICLQIDKSEPMLVNQQRTGFQEEKERRLAIRLKLEEARAYLAISESERSIQGGKLPLQRALSGFDDTQLAVSKWFPEDVERLYEIDEEITKVLLKLGTLNALKKAKDMLAPRLTHIELECQEGRRPWKNKWYIEGQIAHIEVEMSRHTSNVDLHNKAVGTLEELRDNYAKHYGKNHSHYKRCEIWLDAAHRSAAPRYDSRFNTHRHLDRKSLTHRSLWFWSVVIILLPLWFHWSGSLFRIEKIDGGDSGIGRC